MQVTRRQALGLSAGAMAVAAFGPGLQAARADEAEAEKSLMEFTGGEFVLTEQRPRSEEHTSELQSLMRISYAVFCLKKKKKITADKYILVTKTKSTKLTY